MLVVPGVIPGPRRKLFNKETNNNVITQKKHKNNKNALSSGESHLLGAHGAWR